MAKATLLKRLFILRYKYVSQKNFVYLMSLLIGLLAGLVSVAIKNVTFSIQWLLEKSIIFSENKVYFILPIIGLWLVYLLLKRFSKKSNAFVFQPFFFSY